MFWKLGVGSGIFSNRGIDTQVMLILILVDVQYSENAVFTFEKGSNCQNHSSLGSHHLAKNLSSKISKFPPPPSGGIYPSPPTPYCYLENPEWREVIFEIGVLTPEQFMFVPYIHFF